MAQGARYPLGGSPTPALELVAGSFLINTTSTPDGTTGNGATITRTDVGKYLITFDRTYAADSFVSSFCSGGLTGDDKEYSVHFGTIDATAAIDSVIVYHTVGTTDTDTDDLRISWGFWFKNTKATK